MTKLKDLLLPTTIKDYAPTKTPIFTHDLIFIDSFDRIKHVSQYKRIVEPTDYASKNCILDSTSGIKTYTDQILSDYSFINTDGTMFQIEMVGDVHGVCPCIHISLDDLPVDAVKTLFGERLNSKGEPIYHIFKFGIYPQEKKELETNYPLASNPYITKTGKKWVDTTNRDFPNFDEYLFNGKKFIQHISYNKFVSCFEIQPIVWRVRNWSKLPQSINPQGNGTAKFLDLKSEKALFGLYFHDDIIENWILYKDIVKNQKVSQRLLNNCCLWQNSLIRGYLNGIDVNYIKNANGNPAFNAPCRQNFERRGFINAALDIELDDFIKIDNPFYGKDYLDLN